MVNGPLIYHFYPKVFQQLHTLIPVCLTCFFTFFKCSINLCKFAIYTTEVSQMCVYLKKQCVKQHQYSAGCTLHTKTPPSSHSCFSPKIMMNKQLADHYLTFVHLENVKMFFYSDADDSGRTVPLRRPFWPLTVSVKPGSVYPQRRLHRLFTALLAVSTFPFID